MGLVANAVFPLILTFSLREKEQPLAAPIKSAGWRAEDSRGSAKMRGTFLPLQAGEGEACLLQNGYGIKMLQSAAQIAKSVYSGFTDSAGGSNMPAATVALEPCSIRMKEPVSRLVL